MRSFFRFRYFALVTVALLFSGRLGFAQEIGIDIERASRAAVFIMQVDDSSGSPVITCAASGTIVSRGGLVLTNAHPTAANAACPGNDLIVALAIAPGSPPVPTYRASIVQANSGLDLALLQIDRQIDGRLIDTAALVLPFVELADSDTLALDDTLVVVGYTDFAETAVTTLRTTAAGFSSEPIGGDRAWIKSNIILSGSMTGSAAYDRDGRLVGVPTTAPVTGTSADVRCLSLQDTNDDGIISAADQCVPIGNTITVLRPSNFARPLLRAATLRFDLEAPSSPFSPAQTSAPPEFNRLFFAPAVNDAGMPTSVVSSLPAGTDQVFLFFNYLNMTSETVYELRVSLGGVQNNIFSLSPVRWSGGRDGLWYLGSGGQPWPNGIYDFTLLINGIVAGNARLAIGAASQPSPAFSDIAFGIENNSGGVVGTGFVLPAGRIASARFIYRNMQPGLRWAAIWYFQNAEVLRETLEWADAENGTKTIRIQDPSGLLPGQYRLELYLDTGSAFRLAATSDFTLAGAAVGDFARIFEDVHFTAADNPQDALTAPAVSSFPAGVEEIYALFDWSQIRPSTLWTVRWLVDSEPFYEQTLPWGQAETGQDFLYRLRVPGGIPDGTYALELLINRIVFGRAEVRVGIGQLPIDRFAQTSGVQMRGQIFDAQTGGAVVGASVIIISELFDVEQFTGRWAQEQVYATATTDRTGRFIIERLLQPGAPYSLYVVAQGYLPISADGLEVAPDSPNLNLPFYLTRG